MKYKKSILITALAAGAMFLTAFSFQKGSSKAESKPVEPEQVIQINEVEQIYNFTQFKAAIENPACHKLIMKDFTTMIELYGDPMQQQYAVTLNHNKEIYLEGESVFDSPMTNSEGPLCCGLLRVTGNAKLTVTGSGKLEFKSTLPSSVYNSVIYNTNRAEVVFDCPGAQIVGNVSAAVYAKAYIQDTEGSITRFNGGNFWGTTAINSHDNFAAVDILGGRVYVKGGEFNYNITNDSTASMVGFRIGEDVDPTYSEISGGTFNKMVLPQGRQITDFFLTNREYHIYDMNDNIITDINQMFKVSLTIHRFTKQPVNIEMKIDQTVTIEYELDAEPDLVDLCYYNDKSEVAVLQNNIKNNPTFTSNNATGSGQGYFLRATYHVGGGYDVEVFSNQFSITVNPVFVEFLRGQGSGPEMNAVYIDNLYNKYIDLPESEYVPPAGKEFYAWSLKGAFHFPGEHYRVTGDTKFVAVYKDSKVAFTTQPEDGVVGLNESYTLTWDGSFYGCTFKIAKENGSEWDEIAELDNDARSYAVPAKGSAGTESYSVFVYKGDTRVLVSRTAVVRWTSGDVDMFTVTFSDGGTIDEEQTVPGGTHITLPDCMFEAPEDQCFDYWVWSEDMNEYYPGQDILIENNCTLTAHFFEGYTVQIYVAGHQVDEFEHIYGEFELPDFTYDEALPERQYFEKWDVDSHKYFPGDKIDVFGEVIVEADLIDAQFTISYNPGTGSGTMESDVTSSETFVPDVCTFTPPSEHFVFSHWYDATHTIALDPGEPIINNIYEDVVLIAIWKHVEYSYTYNAGDAASIAGNNPVVINNVEAESKVTLRGSDVFKAPEGKHFKTWAVNTADGAKVGSGAQYELLGNTTFIAIWEDDITYTDSGTYTISFAANGGSGSMSALEDQSGNYILPACGFNAPEGKEFKCWNVFGREYEVGATITISRDTIITAVWKDLPLPPGSDSTDTSESTPTSSETTPTTSESVPPTSESGNVPPSSEETPSKPASKGLPAGAVVGIVIGSTLVVGLGGFSIFWFVIKKKSFADLIAIFKKK